LDNPDTQLRGLVYTQPHSIGTAPTAGHMPQVTSGIWKGVRVFDVCDPLAHGHILRSKQ